MVGVSKTFMISADLFFSNRSEVFKLEGGSIYAKYRFLSNDALQKHFRMALFSRLSYNNSDIHQEEINMYGHNTGLEMGIVATQLLRKAALSSTVSILKATDNGNNNKFVYGLPGTLGYWLQKRNKLYIIKDCAKWDSLCALNPIFLMCYDLSKLNLITEII